MVYAVLDANKGTLTYANAGHLPPVLLDAAGSTRLLTDGSSVPLGVPDPDRRKQGDVCLTPGATVLLYTDGLVETRRGDIETDLQALLSAVGRHRPQDGPQVLVDHLTRDLQANGSVRIENIET